MLSKSRFLFLMAGLIVASYCIDTAIDHFFFSGRGFWREFFRPTPEEIYMRGVSAGLLLFVGVIWRVSERRHWRISQALMASEKLYREVVRTCPDSVFIHRDNQIKYLNPVARQYLGLKESDPIDGLRLRDFVHTDDQQESHLRRTEILSGASQGNSGLVKIVLPDERVRHAAVNSSGIQFAGEQAIITYCRDITDEIAVQQNLNASEERLRFALEAAHDGVWDWDMERNEMHYNHAWAAALGLDLPDGVYNLDTWNTLVHPEDKNRAIKCLDAHLAGETRSYEVEIRLRHADGNYVWVLDRGKVVDRSRDGTPRRMAGTHRDITARKEAQIALEIRHRMAEVFLSSPKQDMFEDIAPLVAEALASPIAVIGVIEANHRVRTTTIYRPLAPAETVIKVDHIQRDSLPEKIQSMIAGSAPETTETLSEFAPHGTVFGTTVNVAIHAQGKVLGYLTVANRQSPYGPQDTRALSSLADLMAPVLEYQLKSDLQERQLRQAQKMEAIGALAGGIAHDFNNILQAILGFSTLAREEAQSLGSEARKIIDGDLERVERATRRGRDLVNRILLFSRRQEQEKSPLSLPNVITESVSLLANTIPSTIEVRTEIEPDCPQVLADATQISQVLLNLATNSFHAMEQEGGILTLSLRGIDRSEVDTMIPESLAHHELVSISVSDTGPGIDEETMARLFDPFFTTKEVGKGTGLGLSVVHGIVTSHGGEIIIKSQSGEGTTVQIFLPALAPSQASTTLPTPDAGEAVVQTPGLRILLVDDEQDIVVLGKALLEKEGHFVHDFTDSQQAYSVFSQTPAQFDLVISDHTMPHLTGVQLAEKVSLIRPETPFVLITGNDSIDANEFQDHEQIKAILHKPFSGRELQSAVHLATISDSDENGH